MKVFMAKNYSCGVNAEFHKIEFGLKMIDDCEFVLQPEDADVIIFSGTCSCHEERMVYLINYIISILKRKKSGAKTYLTGCLTRDFIDDKKLNKVKNWLKKNIDFIVPSDRVLDLLKDLCCEQYGDMKEEKGFSYSSNNNAFIYLSRGCTHKCAFCKTTFQDIPLVSMDLSRVREIIDCIDEAGIENLDLKGMNICQFGLDISGEFLLPDVIEYIEKKEHIKNVVLVRFAYADAIKHDFKYVLKKSKKVKLMVGSLESGDNRMLSLMNKGYRIEEFLDFVYFINQEYEKMLDVNIIAGFPTETILEVKKTMQVLKNLKEFLEMVTVCRYSDSSFVDAHKLKQLPKEKIKEHAKIYSKFLEHEGIPRGLI